jgi:hypothetical protein
MDSAVEPAIDPVEQATAQVREAEHVVAELIAQHAAVTGREQRLTAERSKIAYSAHGRGNSKAAARLSAIHRELAEIGSEVSSFTAAIDEAKVRLGAAKQSVAREIERRRAREAVLRAEEMQAAAAGCDDALRLFLTHYDALDRACAAACGITGRPSQQSVRVPAKRSLAAALLSHHRVFDTEVLSPPNRHTSAEIALAYRTSIEAWAAQRLAVPEREEEQAA